MEETPGAILVSVRHQAVESAAEITRQGGDSAPVEAGYNRRARIEPDGSPAAIARCAMRLGDRPAVRAVAAL